MLVDFHFFSQCMLEASLTDEFEESQFANERTGCLAEVVTAMDYTAVLVTNSVS